MSKLATYPTSSVRLGKAILAMGDSKKGPPSPYSYRERLESMPPPPRSHLAVTLACQFFVALAGGFALWQYVAPVWHESGSHAATVKDFKEDPAYGWKDDIWPIRPQKPWDISTDLPHPRTMTYSVQEGTWMRLDVSIHGDIVFDMLGTHTATRECRTLQKLIPFFR